MFAKELNIGFIGLGYAGFPMACLFARKFPVTGFDLSQTRVDELKRGYDRCGDVDSSEILAALGRGTEFTTDVNQLRKCNFYVVVVPTPVDENNQPDFACVKSASHEVGLVLNRGDVVVFESTVYPGATEEICVPEIEAASGLKFNEDFFVGYSPERINPGDHKHTMGNIVKVTSGSTPEAAEYIHQVYTQVLGEGKTWKATSLRVAEACKVVENAQRDVNIAFMNEIAKIMQALGIDTNEVVDAMNTKWNALGFRPGLVGGHCIGVDPYYLIERAQRSGVEPGLMQTAREINNSMPGYVVDEVVRQLEARGRKVAEAQVLLLGFTFKENCPDIRNTRVSDIHALMQQHTPQITTYDPHVDATFAQKLYGVEVCTREEELNGKRFDAVILCVAHEAFKAFDIERYCKSDGFVYDVKGYLPRQNAGGGEFSRLPHVKRI